MKKDSIPKKLLLAIGSQSKDLLRTGATIIFDPKEVVRRYSLYTNYSVPYSKISSGVFNLKRYGYLKEGKINNRQKLYLTSKGKTEIIKNILKRRKKRRWDGKWRMVIFDIPEINRRSRDFLRRELQWIGFKELQKSVWIFPYDFEKEFKVLLKFWKINFQGDIRFLIIEKMNDKDIQKFFGL